VGEIRQKAGVRSQAIGHNYRKIGKGDGGKSENRNPDFLTADYTDLADDRTFLNPIQYRFTGDNNGNRDQTTADYTEGADDAESWEK